MCSRFIVASMFLGACGDATAARDVDGVLDTAVETTAPDTADALPEVTVPDDIVADIDPTDIGPAQAPACTTCTPGDRRCEPERLVTCVEVAVAPGAPACNVWAVETRCHRFAECASPELGCVAPTVAPDGFALPVADASDQVLVHDLIWDGSAGLLTFSIARADHRVIGAARFDDRGPIGTPVIFPLDAQEAALAIAGARPYVHWRSGPGQGAIAEVALPALSLGEAIGATAKDIAQNLDLFGGDGGVVLFQTSVSGGASAFLGWLGVDAATVVWTDATPRFDWNRATAAATARAGGGFEAVWIDDAAALVHGAYDRRGARVREPVANVLDDGAENAAMLGLVRDGDATLAVWSALAGAGRTELWVGHLDSDGHLGSAASTGRDDTDVGAFAELAGVDDDGLWIAFPPDSGTFDAVVLAHVSRDATILSDRLVNTVGGG